LIKTEKFERFTTALEPAETQGYTYFLQLR